MSLVRITTGLTSCQIYDNPGETTLLAAAEVVHSLIQLMADKPVKSLKD